MSRTADICPRPSIMHTVSYPSADYINAGNKTITITAKDGGNYTGSKNINFVINKAPLVSFLNDDTTKIKVEYSNTLITKLTIKLPFEDNNIENPLISVK